MVYKLDFQLTIHLLCCIIFFSALIFSATDMINIPHILVVRLLLIFDLYTLAVISVDFASLIALGLILTYSNKDFSPFFQASK